MLLTVQKWTPGQAVPRGWDKGVFSSLLGGGGGWLTKYMPGSAISGWTVYNQQRPEAVTRWHQTPGGFLGAHWLPVSAAEPWQDLAGPQGLRRLPRGNIGGVVPSVLLHFKVKMWSTHWTGK